MFRVYPDLGTSNMKYEYQNVTHNFPGSLIALGRALGLGWGPSA